MRFGLSALFNWPSRRIHSWRMAHGRDNGPGYWRVKTVASLNGADGFEIEGLANGDSLGATIGAAGDINDDGSGNLIVGAS